MSDTIGDPNTDIEIMNNPELTNPSQLLAMAVSKDLDIAKLEKLMAMQERFDERQARKAFYEAMARFQEQVPEIIKDAHVKFGNTEYKHATLGSIKKCIAPALTSNGLSFRWDFDTTGEIIVKFIVTHADGHSESTEMSAPADGSGSKNVVQSRASTITYLQRYTLIGGLGLTTASDDNDGRTNIIPKPEVKPQPKSWVLPTEFSSAVPFWLEIKGYEKCKGQPFSELPDSLLQKLADTNLEEGTADVFVTAREFAECEMDERERKSKKSTVTAIDNNESAEEVIDSDKADRITSESEAVVEEEQSQSSQQESIY